MPTAKTCFVIAPIGEPESETRKRSDQVLKHIVEPAAKKCGYTAMRADQISKPGIITRQVIQHLAEDPLVVADLTGRNPNVFYELAIRHVVKKPLVQIIKKGEPIPFNVAGTRMVQVDHHDLDSVKEAKREIINQIKSVEKDASQVDNPISVVIDLQLLRHSENHFPLLDNLTKELEQIIKRLGTQATDDSLLQQSIDESQKQLDRVEYVFRAALQNWFGAFTALKPLLQDYQPDKVKSQIARIDQMMTAMADDLKKKPFRAATGTSNTGPEQNGHKGLGASEANVSH